MSLLLLSIGGCGMLVDNAFVVDDPGEVVASAKLNLCGSERMLDRTDHRFSTSMRIDCEGEGKILLRLSNGHEISCLVGYVTPGAKQDFEFVVERSQCR
jgi:hypothetical protein